MATGEIDEAIDAPDDDAFHDKIREIVTAKLSLKGYPRFLRLSGPHEGGYAEERHRWLAGPTREEFLDESRKHPERPHAASK